MAEKGEFKYFSSVEGHAVPRYGAPEFIGCAYRNGNLVWDTEKVVAIPLLEFQANQRAYRRELDAKTLKERTVDDYEKWLEAKEKRNERAKALAAKKNTEETKPPAGEPDTTKTGTGRKEPGSKKK